MIRFANVHDTSMIMDFIGKHWKKNHILSKDKKLFFFQYKDESSLNFVISLTDDKEINGILGFIPFSDNKSDVWLAIWKVKENSKSPILGLELFNFLRNSKENGSIVCSGVNKPILKIYKFLGMNTGQLKHYVLLNNSIKKFQVCVVKRDVRTPIFTRNIENNYNLRYSSEERIDKLYSQIIQSNPIQKSKSYFIKRFFYHPIYKYKVFEIQKSSNTLAIIVFRLITIKNSNLMRIVDYIGNEKYLVNIGGILNQMMINENLEYIDFLSYGFSKNIMEKAGFKLVSANDEDLIIPNYFNPFIQKNIEINFAADTGIAEKLRICIADGDQDRPS